jgi:hypothetical protein
MVNKTLVERNRFAVESRSEALPTTVGRHSVAGLPLPSSLGWR